MAASRLVALIVLAGLDTGRAGRAWTRLSGRLPRTGLSPCGRHSFRASLCSLRPRLMPLSGCNMRADEGRIEGEKRLKAGLLFDCDGTLVNSMPVWANNWVETCQEFGLEMSEERSGPIGLPRSCANGLPW